MSAVLTLMDSIHSRAVEISARYKKAEAELIRVLQQAEEHRVFLKLGYSSTHSYVVRELGLSESVAYNLITVSRKAREVPALLTDLESGKISLTNARRIAPVLTSSNQAEWLEKARTLSQRQLEKEIGKIRPQLATPEKAIYVTGTRLRLELGLFEADLLKLRRVQDLMSQSRRRAVTLEEVLIEMTGDYLKRHDPVQRARRQIARKGVSAQRSTETVETPVSLQGAGRARRESIPAATLHQVNLRDERKCTYVNSRGERCNQTRWLEIHHRKPVSQGGSNTIDNLTTLCFTHHSWTHSAHGISPPNQV